jgi:hypothetical protein
MKSLIFAFFLYIVTALGFAQTKHETKTDEMAIRKVLELESMAAKDSDYNTWIKCFAKVPDLAFGYHPDFPDHMFRGYDELAAFGKKNFPPSPKPSKQTFVFENFRFRINGNTAFTTYLQTNTQEDGKKVRYQKAEYLEKINDEWKMVGHFFYRIPEKGEEAKK